MKNSNHPKHIFHTAVRKRLLPAAAALSILLCALFQSFPVQAAKTDTIQINAAQTDTVQTDTLQINTPQTEEFEKKTDALPEESSAGTSVQPEEETSDIIPSITSIEPLPDEETFFSIDQKLSMEEVTALFPDSLSVHMNNSDESVPLSVTWECSDDYENTQFDLYEFTPVWDHTAYPASDSLKSWDIPSIVISIEQAMADYFLTDSEDAGRKLETLAKGKDILALVYLCDSYEVKKAPGEDEAAVITVSTGQSVQITGVGEDSLHGIWYQVRININDTDYTGYVERGYLAYADEDFLSWENEFVTANKARAAAPALMSAGKNSVPEDIKAFPASYQSALMKLKEQHPDWIFVNMKTEIDWNTAIQQENSRDRSLISSKVNAAWKTASYDNAWSYPSDGILAYYMDPRNFLTENYIFQFELLSYNPTYHTEAAVQDILKNTFMSGAIPNDEQGRTYAQAFYSIAKNLVVSPFHLASRVRQEQGDGKSALISGSHPQYPGVYNYFNIGATGKGSAQIIENGLRKAKELGWTSRYLSLAGGADIITKNYIRKGQDTLYLQKFNVNKTSASGLYNHQYMQNIAAPSSESISVRNAYASAGSINNPFVFRIPVYENMPATPCAQPSGLKSVTLNTDKLTLKTDETAVLTASVDGKAAAASSVSFSSSNAKVAAVAADGTVTAISSGTAEISCTTSGGSTAVCTVTVQKNTPAYTVPALNPVSYDPKQTLQKITLPAGWAWENPSIVPTVGNSGYPAVYTPADTGKYLTVKETLALSVTKGTPAYTVPTGLQTITGATLASLKLPAGWTWDNPSTALTKAGTFSYPASYNPDAANYQTVTGISVSVTVTEKAESCTTHNYGAWVITTPASCTKAGTQTRSCQQCGTTENTALPAIGHNYTSAVTRPATESVAGIRTYTCSRCGDTYTEEIAKLPAAHKHSYTAAITTAAACDKAGVQTYTCSCGDTYTETVPASGHSYTAKVTKEATETENGIRTYTCSKCQDTYTENIDKLPSSHKHSYVSSVTKQPACTENGVKSYLCSCGDNYTENIAALGHDMSSGKCRRCGYTQQVQNTGGNTDNTSGNSSSGNSSSGNSSDDNHSGSNDSDNSGSGSNDSDDNSSDNSDSDDNSSDDNDSDNNSSGGNDSDDNSSSGNDSDSNSSDSSGSGGSNTGSNGSNSSSSGSAGTGSGNQAGSNPGAASGSAPGNGTSGSNMSASNAGNSSTAASPAGSATSGSQTQTTHTGNDSADNNNKDGVSIDMQKTSVLYEETISSIRGQDIDVTLNMGNGICWTINGRNIIADEANGIDMGIETDASDIPEAILTQAALLSETGTVIKLALAHDGPFDFQPILTFQTDAAFAGCTATLFYYRTDAGKLEYINETTVTEAGEIVFPFSHASDYVIIISNNGLSDIAAITEDGTEGPASNDGAQQGEQPEDGDAIAVSAVPAQDEENTESGGFNPMILLIVLLIVLILIIIGCTAFLMFRPKDAPAEEELPDDKSEEDFYEAEEDEKIEIEYLDADEEIFDEEPAGKEYLGEKPAGKKYLGEGPDRKEYLDEEDDGEEYLDETDVDEPASDEEPLDEYSEEDDYYEPESRPAKKPGTSSPEFDDGFDGFE